MRKLLLPVGRRLPSSLKAGLYNIYRRMTEVHQRGAAPDVMLFTMPRSGSTWLMELIWSQPGFKCVNEPFDIRLTRVQKALGLETWTAIQNDGSLEKIEAYLNGYLENRIHVQEVAPHANKFYRRRTSRIIFKIIHAGENHITHLKDRFAAKVVFMTRHPIAVALSRDTYPRLEAHLESDFRNSFTAAQLALAQNIVDTGTKLQKGVLDWCFQNAAPLRDRQGDWAVLSYEQLVLDPTPVIHYLAEKLELPDEASMYKRLFEASGVRHKSDLETKRILAEHDSEIKRLRLVSKWQAKVSKEETHDAFRILEVFDIDAYSSSSLLPKQDLWIGDHYQQLRQSLATRNVS